MLTKKKVSVLVITPLRSIIADQLEDMVDKRETSAVKRSNQMTLIIIQKICNGFQIAFEVGG